MTVNLEYRIFKIHVLLLKVYTLLIKKSIIIVSTLFNIVIIYVFQLWFSFPNLYKNIICIHLYIVIPCKYLGFIDFNICSICFTLETDIRSYSFSNQKKCKTKVYRDHFNYHNSSTYLMVIPLSRWFYK